MRLILPTSIKFFFCKFSMIYIDCNEDINAEQQLTILLTSTERFIQISYIHLELYELLFLCLITAPPTLLVLFSRESVQYNAQSSCL